MNDEQTPALREAVENMANMREAYDNLSQAAEAYNTGKTELAANITAKGVPASATETLPELAEKVVAIAQTQTILEGGEIYAAQLFGDADPATNPLWNLYEVLVQLKNQYLVSSGGNYQGILLGRFYKGYESIALGYADSYVTSDGHFYTTGATHVWADENDAHADRWVAYLFVGADSNFIIETSSLCPRDIYIGGTINKITFYTNGRLGSIVCGIEETDVLGRIVLNSNETTGYTNPWGKDVVIRGLKNTPATINYGNNVENIIISGKRVSIPLQGSFIAFNTSTNIITFTAPELEEIYFENSSATNQLFGAQTGIVSIRMPLLKKARSGGIAPVNGLLLYSANKPRLIDFEVGAMEYSIRLDHWNPTAVLASASMKAQLVTNIKNHILAKVSDRTGLSRLTCTFSTDMYNAIASTNIEWNGETMSLADAFLTKNWLLSGA